MEIVFHLGAHLTDRDHLTRCLLRNRQALAERGISVPSPGDYRGVLRPLIHEMAQMPTSRDTQEALLDGLIDEDAPNRIFFSDNNLIALPQWAVSRSQLYPAAGERLGKLAHVFPEADLTFAMALRDPATFLPALHAQLAPSGTEGELMSSDPMALIWSDLVLRMQAAVPGATFLLWRDEDVPLIWPEILRAVAGVEDSFEFDGWFAWYWDIMSPKAHETMRRYFASNPSPSDAHRRRVLAAMLDKFVSEEALTIDPLPPGWSDELQDRLSARYDADLDLIATLPGVTLLEP